MRDLKILWLGKNDAYKMSCFTKYFREELARQAEVSTYGIGWPHPAFPTARPWKRKETDVLKLIHVFKPDYIYIDLYWNWENLDKTDVPATVFWSDPHGYVPRRVAWVTKSKIDACLMPYVGVYPGMGIQKYREMLPESIRIKYFPLSVNVDVFKDYGYERDIDLCLLGRMGFRPLRATIFKHYRDSKKYKVFHRPRPKRNWNWPDEKLKKFGYVARESYAKLLARCKAYPFGVKRMKYAVTKFFEAMAAKTLVLSNSPAGADRLHFVPNETFVEINMDNFKEKVDYYLKNADERAKIVDIAHRTIHKYHTTKIRVRELLDYVENELL